MHVWEQPPQEFAPRDSFHCAQLFCYSEAAASMAQGGTVAVWAGWQPWHHPHAPGFTRMRNVRITGIEASSKISEKAWVGGSKRKLCEAVEMKPNMQGEPGKSAMPGMWKSTEDGFSLWMDPALEGGHLVCSWQGDRGRAAEASETHISTPCALHAKYGATGRSLLFSFSTLVWSSFSYLPIPVF